MKVKLISHTYNPEQLVAIAARLCYSSVDADELQKELTPEKSKKFVNMLMDLGHQSPLEHTTFTFVIEGVSRSLTHQLVRHRIASYNQRSQRYVTEDNFEYITPKTIQNNPNAKLLFEEAMNTIRRIYSTLIDMNISKEDARYVLPNACETKIMVTMNARSLLHFFNERCCNRAQWEIRDLAIKMLKLCKQVAPEIFKNAGPKCLVYNRCPESKMSCGKFKEIKEKFQNL